MIEVVDTVIDIPQVLASVKSNSAGAVVLFTGTTREFTDEKQTVTLKYDCYREMAIKEMQTLSNQAADEWALVKIAIVHRVGEVPLGETSVAIAVSSKHRPQAFEASRWLIDQLKEKVPIWKQENYVDGETEWVHPGITSEVNPE